MTDDSEAIPEKQEFHPCDTPRGCTYYTGILTDCQQMKLNQLKSTSIKNAHRYLRTHPEIRGYIFLISRYIFKQQPRRDIAKMIKEFFDRPQLSIDYELDNYLESLPEPDYDNEYFEEEEAFLPKDLEEYLRYLPTSVEELPVPAHKDQESRTQIESFVHELLESKIAEIVPSTSIVDIKSITEKTQSDKSINNETTEKTNKSAYSVKLSNTHSRSTARISILSETSNDRVLAMKIASKIKKKRMSMLAESKTKKSVSVVDDNDKLDE